MLNGQACLKVTAYYGIWEAYQNIKSINSIGYSDFIFKFKAKITHEWIKGCFPLGGIFRAERNSLLYFCITVWLDCPRQRKIPLRAENSA